MPLSRFNPRYPQPESDDDDDPFEITFALDQRFSLGNQKLFIPAGTTVLVYPDESEEHSIFLRDPASDTECSYPVPLNGFPARGFLVRGKPQRFDSTGGYMI